MMLHLDRVARLPPRAAGDPKSALAQAMQERTALAQAMEARRMKKTKLKAV